jgi:uncharacterized protein
MPYAVTLADGSVQLALHVQPKAAKNRLLGLHDGCLKVAVASLPLEGRANLAVRRFVAELLGVATRDVQLHRGTQGRKKLLLVRGIDASTVRAKVAASLIPAHPPRG